MATAASAAGFGTGLRLGLDSARQRRIEEEERQRQHRREDLDVQASELGLARMRRQADREPDDLARQRAHDDLDMESGRFTLESARQNSQRAAQEHNEKRAAVHRQMEEEGMHDVVNSLGAGVNPKFVLDRFNGQGDLKLRDLQFDPGTKRVHLVDSDGDVFDGSLEQLGATFGVGQPALVKLGKDERLVDPRTRQTLVAPDARPSTTTYAQFLVPLANKLAAGQSLTPGEQRAADLLQHTGVLDRMLNEAGAGAGGGQGPASAGVQNSRDVDDDELVRQARQAIAQGKDRDAVRSRLRELGVDPDRAGL